jgi:CDP-diglyceride synthetase
MLKARIISAMVGIPIMIGLTWWGEIPFFVLIISLVLVGLYEFFLMLGHQDVHPNLTLGMI